VRKSISVFFLSVFAFLLAACQPASMATAEKNHPVAAMHSTDAGHGISVIPSAGGGNRQGTAFHTSDGGASWSEENVTDVFGFPVISEEKSLSTKSQRHKGNSLYLCDFVTWNLRG
jgi:hypothetical protein